MAFPKQQTPPPGHDIVVIGASLGGIEALSRLLHQLDPGVPVIVLIVRHSGPETFTLLDRVLGRHSTLPVQFGQNNTKIRHGHVYIAPPDRHMLLSGDRLRIVHGPRENWTRPAIDPLFRSAAVNYRSRVIGIILSGLLDDGSAGLATIKRCGGLAIVQHPEDATSPDMPLNAMRAAEVDYSVPVAEMGELLNRLIVEPAPVPPPIPDDLALEVHLTETVNTDISPEYSLGSPSPYVCPECGGPLWEVKNGKTVRYRCHIGHTFGMESLLEGQRNDLEKAMWTAVRIIEQNSRLLDRLISECVQRRQEPMAATYRRRKAEVDAQSAQIREYLVSQHRAALALEPEESSVVGESAAATD